MLLLFFIYKALSYTSDPTVTMDDIVFVVWSGKECLPTRVYQLAQAWYGLVPHVHVYTDEADESIMNNITNSNPHLSITFHITQMRGDYLIGSYFENPYNHAQSRHILSMYDIYNLYPNKKWYFFCDDDCYVLPTKVLELCRTAAGNVFGMTYYFIDETYKFFPSGDPTRTFHHGGPGIAVTHQFMVKIAPHLMECNSIYQASKLGSDIRLSACYGRIFGLREWYYRTGESSAFGMFNSNTPDRNIDYSHDIPERTLSFHLIQPQDTIKTWKSHISTWNDQSNTSLYVDWSPIALQRMDIDLGNVGYTMEFYIWYCLRYESKNYYPIGNPKPIFRPGDKFLKDPIAYEQEYENGFRIRLNCDADRGDDLIQEGFAEPPIWGATLSMKCPKPTKFYTNHNSTIPAEYRIIPVDHK